MATLRAARVGSGGMVLALILAVGAARSDDGATPAAPAPPAAPAAAGAAAPSTPAATESATAPKEAPPPAAADPRPVVRLQVRSDVRKENTLFPQLVEGRLISDLADMETFRTVGPDLDGQFRLECTIREFQASQGTSYQDNTRDAESDGRATTKDTISVAMSIEIVLTDAAGSERLRKLLTTDATREIERSADKTMEYVIQDAIDRAAQKIEKLLRKKVRIS